MKRGVPLERRTALRSDPEEVRSFVQRGRTAAAKTWRPRAISPASPEQREKCRGRVCVNCADPGPCDPAHLTPRSLGGCDHPDCVLPLCRGCHSLLDLNDPAIDLTPVLALPEFAAERSHMAGHMSFHACIRRLGGDR